MIRFNWMAQMQLQIPKDWGVNLQPMTVGETLVGLLPGDLVEPFMLAIWANERAHAILAAHQMEDGTLGNNRPECAETEVTAMDLRHRSDTLLAMVHVGIKETYHLSYIAEVKVRYEGVVVVERRGHTVIVVPRSVR